MLDLVLRHNHAGGRRLLEVACGTGQHTSHLSESFDVDGMDLDDGLLEVARQRCPNLRFVQGDMTSLDMGDTYDAITCLFSSIGYVVTEERLRQAIASMARHLKPGGVLLVEPWFDETTWKPGGIHVLNAGSDTFKVVRMSTSTPAVDGVTRLEFHYLVGTPEGVEHFTEIHELGLFTREQYEAAFRAAGLRVEHDGNGLTGRGLYIGHRDPA